MPRKSLQYYKNTLILKLAAQSCWLLDNFGALDGMKNRTKLALEDWLKLPVHPRLYDSHYIAYGFLKHPSELEDLLIFDKNGIPFGWKHANPTAHNPLMVSYLALVYYNYHRTSGDAMAKESLCKLLDFLKETSQKTASGLWLAYHQSVPKYGLEAPWYSGLAQAVAMSAFLRGFELTGKGAYRDCAQLLCKTLLLPTELGGFLEKLGDGGTWVQEYPTSAVKQVLNGLLFCLIGMYEYQLRIGGMPQLSETIAACESTFFERLPNYLFGRFTRYAWDKPRFSNIEYQGLFVFLFLHLYKLSGKPVYNKLAIRFHHYTDWPAFFQFYGMEHDQERLPQILLEQ